MKTNEELIALTSNPSAAESILLSLGYTLNTIATFSNNIASSIIDAAENKPIVILGRDAEPLYWKLKELGEDAQYFLFSRLQLKSATTKRVVREEIKPNSLIVDTGYSGTIIRAISHILGSSNITGRLISGSHYPMVKELYIDFDWACNRSSIVEDLEALPKLISRSIGFMPNGKAKIGHADRYNDECDDDIENIHVMRELLCMKMDVSTDWARYTGITKEERLYGLEGMKV